MRYSDYLTTCLQKLGYTHCFYVAGGNIMHLLASARTRFHCVSVIHEVAAGIAAEYFNESGAAGKAFVLVTAGPGLTNITTAIAGAYLESRELLVIGGQVKTSDLSRGVLRQRGIQEVPGTEIVRPITKRSVLLDRPIAATEFGDLVAESWMGRKGPVFLEIPLDVQGAEFMGDEPAPRTDITATGLPMASDVEIAQVIAGLRAAKRPLLLIGGGVERAAMARNLKLLERHMIPIATTWNGMDRISFDHPLYVGRPNTWGQRYSNLLIQQSDYVVALGSRLGLQQTGFNWQEFVPGGQVVQVDCDPAELTKGHPDIEVGICSDANYVVDAIAQADVGSHRSWLEFCQSVKNALPLIEPINTTGPQYLSPYVFAQQLSAMCSANDAIVPCSSGGAFTVMMQTFQQKSGQTIITNKGLASMGYGLSGAIGAAFAHRGRRVVLVEGDGGFAQNLQELGTVAASNLNIKMFIFDDGGYASIRMTQKNYFGGQYMGCDRQTGLGLPDWTTLFVAYRIPVRVLGPGFEQDRDVRQDFECVGPVAFLVQIDPDQTYFPKISSRITPSGSMASDPLHRMTPELNDVAMQKVAKYLGSVGKDKSQL